MGNVLEVKGWMFDGNEHDQPTEAEFKDTL